MENNSTPGEGLLDGVEQAPGFDMDAHVAEAASREKQRYDHVHVDPETALAGELEPEPAPGEGTAMGAMARRKAAKGLMLMLDRAQAGIFTLFGARGHLEEFRFNAVDRAEMAGYLEEGLPENFRMPWYIPFGILLITQLAMNWSRLQEIKEAKARADREAAAAKQAEQQERERTEPEQQLADRFRERRERRASAPPAAASTTAQAPAAETGGKLCEECAKKPTVNGNRYCSPKCRARANGRKNKAPAAAA